MFWFTNGNWSRSSKKSITITGQCSKEVNPIINILIISLISKHQVQVHKILYYLPYMVYGILIYLILHNSQKTLLNVILHRIIHILNCVRKFLKKWLHINSCYMTIFSKRIMKVDIHEEQTLFFLDTKLYRISVKDGCVPTVYI